MKLKLLVAAACAALGTALFAAGELDDAVLHGETDKARAIDYAPGETMTFTLTLQRAKPFPDGAYFIKWKRSGDDGVVEEGKVPASTAKPFVYRTKTDKPGFVRLTAFVVDKDGKRYQKSFHGNPNTPEGKAAMNRFERMDKRVFFDGGAGVQPEKLVSHPEPADFDAFWAKQYARLDTVPIKPELIELPCGNPKARIYAVQVPCAGPRPVTGYLTVPKAVDAGAKFPCRLETHGYSGDRCQHPAPGWARDNEIVLNINAHGQKLPAFGATEADRQKLLGEIRSNGYSYAFDPAQNSNPETAYFNGMVLRVKRALQYLKTVKGWDGKNLIASGGSQGGLQTIWAAGCGEGVTRAESGITWCCDMYTSGKLRKDPALKLAGDGWYIAWTDALGYYDAANFARRIPKTCYTFITRAGLGDYCCPPTGITKMWNNMTCPKKILWVQGSTHGYVPPEKHQDFVIEEPAK